MYVTESAYGSSNLARKFNNVLGMKQSKKRGSTATRVSKNGYSVYPSVMACFADFKIYELEYLKGKSRAEYLRYLREVYSRDKNYLREFE